MIRNQAGKLTVFAFNVTTNAPVTGDAANITCKVSKDDAALASVTDTNPTEISSTDAPGMYRFDLLAGETDADKLEYFPKSSTSNVQVLALPSDVIYTRPANFSSLSIDANGRLDVIKVAGTTQTARDLGASVLISAGTGSGQLDVTSGRIKADLTHILATALDDDIIGAVGLTTIAENLSIFFGSNANSTNNVNGYSSIAVIESSTSIIQGTVGVIDTMIQLDGANYEFKASALQEAQSAVAAALTAYDPPTKAELDSAVSPLATAANLATVAGYLDTEVAAILEDTGTTIPAQISALSIPTANQIADALLIRDVDNVEASAPEHSLTTVILACLEMSISGSVMTIKRTDGSTTHVTKTLTTSNSATPITGIT